MSLRFLYSHDDFQIIPAASTNWEEMADMLGKPQNIATIEALRRIIGEPRVVSSNVHSRNMNGAARVATQLEIEIEYSLPPPSVFVPKSRCSSPSCSTSNRSSLSPHSTRSSYQPIITQTTQVPPKSPSRKFLSTSRSPYSSPRVVRKRCAVCCEKYKYDENNNNTISNNTITRRLKKHQQMRFNCNIFYIQDIMNCNFHLLVGYQGGSTFLISTENDDLKLAVPSQLLWRQMSVWLYGYNIKSFYITSSESGDRSFTSSICCLY